MFLPSAFIVMTIDEVTLNRPKVGTGFTIICWLCRLRLSRFALNFSTEMFTPYRLFQPLFLTILLYHLLLGIWIHHLLADQHFLCVDSSKRNLWRIQLSKSSKSASEYLLSKFLPRSHHSPERFLVTLSCQIDEFSPDLSVKTDDIQLVLQKVLLALWMEVSINAVLPWISHHFRRMFPIWVLRNVCGCMHFCGL